MGIVTVLVTSNCPFCDVVLGELDEALKSIGDDASNVRIQTLDISRSAALAKQCAQLSQTTSVPQVFFNAKHIGVRAARSRGPQIPPHAMPRQGAQIVRRLRERGELRPLLEDCACIANRDAVHGSMRATHTARACTWQWQGSQQSTSRRPRMPVRAVVQSCSVHLLSTACWRLTVFRCA